LRASIVFVLVCAALVGAVIPARADDAPSTGSPSAPPSPASPARSPSVAPTADAANAETDAPPARYQELVDRALAESAAGRWEEARATFREAHALFPNARTLRGIGVVAFELRDYVDAVRHLRQALAESRRALTDAQRTEADGLLQRSLALVARYDTSELPADAAIAVDGHTTTRDGQELLVAVGERTVQVRAGTRVGEARLRVRGGEMEPLPVVLEEPRTTTAAPPESIAVNAIAPAAVAAPETHPVEDDLARSEPRGASDSGGSKLGPIVTMVGGGALLVTGAVLFLVGQGDISDVENAPPGTEWATVRSKSDRALVLTGLGLGFIGTGGALGIAGTVWFFGADASGGSAGASRKVLAGVRGRW
jgi:hypothetical protein